ncbi:MAG: S41 family peptidase [Flavobacteriia bacterium]|nr:S41 family peptidase [Flavobacteriia bacterium]
MNNKKFNFLIPISLASFLAIGLWLGNLLSGNNSPFGFTKGKEKTQKLQDIIDVLDAKYVDKVNGEELFEKTIGDMLHQLDPHSNYIPAKDLKAVNESIEGKFGGIGVRFFVIRDTICITNVIPYSPSASVGLKAGDKVIQIESKTVAGKKMNNDKIMSMLKGDPGTSVRVQVLRGKVKLNKTISRGIIPIESVICAKMVSSAIGYLKIEQFSVSTYQEFMYAITNLKAKGMKKLIIDLRNNGGGVLQTATQIVDECLKGNLVIVKTKGIHQGERVYRSASGGSLEGTAVCVLMNENSASASEILAGALQDNDRGTIIGRRSFGKGLVQEDIRLRDGSDLRLTIARYYTPTGRCIQKPYEGSVEEYYQDQYDRMSSGELYHIDTTVFVDSLKFKTPKGKIVYGGGGIMPDIFIPYDSSGTSIYYSELMYSGAFQGFAFDFVSDKRFKWNSAESFNKTFNISESMLTEFTKYASKYFKVRENKNEFSHSKALITKVLKQEIARQLWIEVGSFEVSYPKDKEIQKAILILK